MKTRKIIHIDMDAFYASVELKKRPDLANQPVVVAWEGLRSVICAASYPARKYGLRSAMSVTKAKQLCPHAIFIPPHFDEYRAISKQIRQIFQRYTDLIEPLSLDEAYLDVTENKINMPSATWLAEKIRQDIVDETGLTASAGIAPNKFLAKIASDWNKPNGQFVISPQDVATFIPSIPLAKIPGVGQKTLQKMDKIGLKTIADIQPLSSGELNHYFGRYGYRLYDLARGIDHRQVDNSQDYQQISTEVTFETDLSLDDLSLPLKSLCQSLWQQAQRKDIWGKTITLKVKTTQFQTLTRSLSFDSALETEDDLLYAAQILLTRLNEPQETLFRLLGIGLSQLQTLPEIKQQLNLDLFAYQEN